MTRRWIKTVAHKRRKPAPAPSWRAASRSKAITLTGGRRSATIRRGGVRSGIRLDVTDVGLGWRNRPWW